MERDMVFMRKALHLVLLALVRLSAGIYEAEGLNVPFQVMPSRLIAPVMRMYGAQVGMHVRFLPPVTIHNAASRPVPFFCNLSVGDDCFFGRDLFLDLQDRIVVEDKVTVSHRVIILTHTDVGESPLRDGPFPPSQAPVALRRGAYIGAGAIILPGAEIGECAVVGAGAVVTKSIPPYTVVTGMPARPLRTLGQPNWPKEVPHAGAIP